MRLPNRARAIVQDTRPDARWRSGDYFALATPQILVAAREGTQPV
jgi:hypothetical protein